MILRFRGFTQWAFGYFLLLCLRELLVFRPIPSMPVEVINDFERALLVEDRCIVVLPQLTRELHVERCPVAVAFYLCTVFRACH